MRGVAGAGPAGHRGLLVRRGTPAGARAWAEAWLLAHRPERVLWVGSEAPEGVEQVAAGQAVRHLGREFDALVFDAAEAFHADAFGAVSGTLAGGGTLLLLLPTGPSAAGSRFVRRLERQLAAGLPPGGGGARPVPAADADPAAVTADQAAAVVAVCRVATGHRRRPLVLTADRGRGKSAALGIAAARLLERGHRRLLVTAPSRRAVDSLFAQAERLCAGRLAGRLDFVPADVLLRERPPADLLLVDEAAALPVDVLERLLRQYPRVAFATTIHGYEGTGRGFAVRFRAVLDARTPQWRERRLATPVRWAPGDPLEALVYRVLLLDAEPAVDREVAAAAPGQVRFERLDRDRLVDDEVLLRETFGLLVLAHYQTRPGDLVRLLDDADVGVWVGRYAGRVVATAVVRAEGGFAPELAAAVTRGERRLPGQLLPQTLAAHGGFEAAACLCYARVMRIAVHPAALRRGIGGALLAAVAAGERADLLGASFGATAGLAAFWRAAGCVPVRVGMRRDPASGEHSLVVLRPLTAGGRESLAALREAFAEQFERLLVDGLQDLASGLVAEILADLPRRAPGGRDAAVLARYARGQADYAQAVAPLHRLAWNLLAEATADGRGPDERTLLAGKVLQAWSWTRAVAETGATGRGEAEAWLRAAVARLVGERATE